MPTPSQVNVSQAVSAFAAGYSNGKYVADLVCPVIPSATISGTYFTKAKKDIAMQYEDLLGPKSAPAEVSYAQSSTSYTCLARGLMGWVPYSLIDNAADPLNPRLSTASTVMTDLALQEEIRVATLLLATASYALTNTSAAAAKWTDEASGNPVKDIHTMIAACAPGDADKTKLVMILALEAAQALSRHPSILSLRAGGATKSGVVSMEEISPMFGLDSIVVSDAIKQTANDGQTATFSRIWDATKAVVVRIPKNEPNGVDDLQMFASRFRWNASNNLPFEAVEWDDPKQGPGKGSLGIKISHWTSSPAVVQNDMGYCLTTIT